MIRKIAGFFLDCSRSSLEGVFGSSATRLAGRIYPLEIPLPADEKTGWKPYAVFSGSTRRGEFLACHVSVLSSGSLPHPVHEHREDEILLLLSGELEIFISDEQVSSGTAELQLKPDHLLYYPAHFSHTIRSVGKEPANYLMVKWFAARKAKDPLVPFRQYELAVPEKTGGNSSGFIPHLLFEGKTACLEKVRCHITRLAPGSGYRPHADSYDVVIVMLEGEAETLGERVRPQGIIFYPSGEPHGMHNPGTGPARYLVLELHW